MTKRNTAHRPRFSQKRGLTVRELNHVIGALEELGILDRLPADLVRLTRRAEELEKQAAAGPDNYRSLEAGLAARLAAGEVSVDEAVAEAVVAVQTSDRDGAGIRIVTAASDHARRQAASIVLGRGDELITELLAPFADEVVQATVRAYEALPAGVENAQDAVTQGGKAATAWRTLTEQADLWRGVVALACWLRLNSIIEGSTSDPYLWFEHPEAAGPRHTGPLYLAHAIAAGAEPRLITEGEACRRVEEAEVKRLEERDAQRLANARPRGGASRSTTGSEDVDWALGQIAQREQRERSGVVA